MMKSLWAGVLALVLVSVVHAGGQRENFKPVNGLENWHYDFDIKDLKPDTYNLVIRARDAAGNVSMARPINFRVDPASDIPSIRIGSPLPGQRSTGNINVVGTALDDDGIDYVEVQLGKDGEIVRANGQRYWSYFFNLESLPDGIYTVRARATDINGKQSPWAEVSFHLDQKKPIHAIESHPQGALVRGRFRVRGTITEPNGIAKFFVSEGSPDQFREQSFSRVNDQGLYRFEYEVDTSRQNDGPNILYFRSVNLLGNSGEGSFLYIVDNTPPKAEFFYPPTEENLPGLVTIVGAIQDEVGVSQVTWEADGNQRGQLELVPGNPFFSVPLSYPNQSGRRRIRFRVEDRIGNVRSFEHQFTVSQDADRPKLTASVVSEPNSPISVVGFAQDPDGISQVNWSVEGGPSGQYPTQGAFHLELPPLQPGKRRLTLVARDSKGVESLPVRLELDIPPRSPVWDVSSFQFVYGSGATARRVPYKAGMFLPAEGQNDRPPVFTGRILTDDPRLGEVIFTVAGGRGGRVGTRREGEAYRFEIPLQDIVRPNTGNVNLKGPITVNLSVRGSVGSEVPYTLFIRRETSAVEAQGVLHTQGLGTPERWVVTQDHPFSLVAAGEFSTVQVQPASQAIQVEVEPQGEVTLVRVLPGPTAGVARGVRLSAGGVDLGTYTFVSDLTPPELTVRSPEVSSWHSTSVTIGLQIADNLPVPTLEYALGQGEYRAVPGYSAQREISVTIPLGEVSDGPLPLRFRAVDAAGNVRIIYHPLFKSSAPAQVSLLAPPQGVAVDGKTLVVGQIRSEAPVVKLEYSEDNRTWEAMEVGPFFQRFIDFSRQNLPEVFRFRVTTASGVMSTLEARFQIDRQRDIPQVSVQIPAEREVMRTDFAISGLVVDDDGVGAIYLRLNGQGNFVKLEGANSFSFPIPLSEIEDQDHFVEVYAEDINGTRSEVIKRNFTVSRSGPTSQLAAPDVRVTQRGKVYLRGFSVDPNGVEAVFLSIDNGNTFYRMTGTEQWSYQLDTTLLQDGIYTLLIRSVDKTGAIGDYNVLFSVDNTPPLVTLTSPTDGEQVTAAIRFEGRAEDNMILRTLRYSIRPIGAVRNPLTGEFPISGAGLTQQVNIEGLAPGWYNIALEAIDDAGNVTLVTRNVQVLEQAVADRVEISFPALGQTVSGPLGIMGRVFAKQIPEKAVVLINKRIITTIDVNPEGYFNGVVMPADLEPLIAAENRLPGRSQKLEIQVEIQVGNQKVASLDRQIEYQIQGPWIRITSHKHGDYISNRPFLTGYAGYFTLPQPAPAEGEQPQPWRYGEAQLTLEEIRRQGVIIEASLNNGMTFERVDQWEARVTEGSGLARGDREWRYRLQTHTFSQGPITVLIRALFPDGSMTTARMVLITDTVPPKVEVLVPDQAEGSFNEVIRLAGTASDESKLVAVEVALNRGRYTPPSFIEGVYADGYALGATLWSAGLGFFFFQEAVRLQVQTGHIALSPDNSRFYGFAHAVKLMAKVFTLEWESVFGPDAEFFSSSVLVGANFSLFTQDQNNPVPEQDKMVVLTSFLGQVEFLQLKNRRWWFFNSISAYAEYSGWIISSDLSPTVVSRLSFGARLTLWNQVRER